MPTTELTDAELAVVEGISLCMDCRFCVRMQWRRKDATKLAPQFDGGDPDRPAIWVPVCDDHFAEWYKGAPFHLPAFDMPTAEQVYANQPA